MYFKQTAPSDKYFSSYKKSIQLIHIFIKRQCWKIRCKEECEFKIQTDTGILGDGSHSLA